MRKIHTNGIERRTIWLMLLVVLAAVALPVGAETTEPLSFQTGMFIGSEETTIPIETMTGMSSLSLNFNSFLVDELGFQQPSMVGLGWNLPGVNDHVEKVGPSDYILIHDGKGYKLVKADDGWHTTPETFWKITQESGWKVIETDGTVNRYGQDSKSQLEESVKRTDGSGFDNGETKKWFLDEVVNADGIREKRSYAKLEDEDDDHEYSIYPNKIECCFDSSSVLIGNLREVIFTTSSRSDVNELYKGDGEWEERKIDSIQVWINGKPVRKYDLSYDYSSVYVTEKNFKDPGFETGSKDQWVVKASYPHKAEVDSGESKTGEYSLKMTLESSPGEVEAHQTVFIPYAAPFLHFWYRTNAMYDEYFGGLDISVYDPTYGIRKEFTVGHAGVTSSEFEEKFFDLAEFAGKEVVVYIKAKNTAGDNGMGGIYLDDVTIGTNGPDSGFLTLRSVTLSGSDGVSFSGSLPATVFDYADNLLIKVDNGMGGNKSFVYEAYIPNNEFSQGYVNSQKRHRVIEETVDDGLENFSVNYSYGKGIYNTGKKEFYGHDKVIQSFSTGEVINHFYNQSDSSKGMLEGTETWGSDGKLYATVKNSVNSKNTELFIPKEDQFIDSSFEDSLLVWTEETDGSGFVQKSDEEKHTGSFSAKLLAGGSSSESGSASLSQKIKIPEDAKYISYFAIVALYPAGSSTSLTLTDASGNVYELKTSLGGNDWEEQRAEISEWAGEEVTFTYIASQEFENSPEVIVYIDDVSFLHRTSLISFPYVSGIRTYSFEGTDTAKMTLATFELDEFGNVIDTVNYGEWDEANNQDIGCDKTEKIVENINDNVTTNILGLPKHITIKGCDIGDQFVVQRESKMFYDGQDYGGLTKGKLTKVQAYKDAENFVEMKMGYDLYGNPEWTDDPNGNLNPETGHTTFNAYDDVYHTYLIKSCNALNYCEGFGYDELMRSVEEIDINGQSTLRGLDNFGREIKLARPGDTLDAPTVQTVYQDVADFKNGIYPYVLTILNDGIDGLRSYKFLDGFGKTVQTKAESVGENEWLTADINYFMGRLERVSMPYTIATATPEQVIRKDINEPGIWTIFSYDPIGRQNKTTKPDGTFTETVFGKWLTEAYDALRHKMAAYTDGLGMTVKIENYIGSSPETYQLYATTLSKFNTGSGELVKLTDPAGNEQLMSFNWLGWQLWMNDPNLGNWSNSRDNNGNVVSETDAKNQTIKSVFDALNRRTLRDFPSQFDAEYGYDNCANGKGKLCIISGGDKKYKLENNFEYDVRGRPVNFQLKINNKSWNISKGYDSMDRIVFTTYPDNETVAQRWNKAGLIGSPDGILPAVQSNLYGDYPYLKNVLYGQGRPTGFEYGNGRTTLNEYNDAPEKKDPFSGKPFTYQLIGSITDGGVQSLGYGRDDSGKVVLVVDGLNPNNTANFKLDDLSRLISANSGMNGNLEFGYNNIGNFITKEGSQYVYPESGPGSVRPNAPIRIGNESFGYDLNGNMNKTSGGRSFVHDFDNKVIKIMDNKTVKGSYLWLEGRRIVKIEDGIETYNINGIQEEEYWVKNGSKKAITKYYLLEGATAIRTIPAKGKQALRFVHKDQLGSSTAITNERGNLTLRIIYEPFGEEVKIEGKKSENKLLNQRFAGQKKDFATELYCSTARCYNPVYGIFLSPDTVEGPNRYSYANNDPVNNVDPTGNFVIAAAAIPIIVDALPVFTLAITGYLASNWEEPIIGAYGVELTGADVASFAMPLPIGGKAKIAKGLSEAAEEITKKKLRKELVKSRANKLVLVEEQAMNTIKDAESEAMINHEVRQMLMKELQEQGLTEMQAFRKIASKNFEGIHIERWKKPLENIKDLSKEERKELLKKILYIEWKE